MRNVYLQGNFAPTQEESHFEKLEVIGTLPPELEGALIRNGPNHTFIPSGQHSRIDGNGMLHMVTFRNGEASYRNRYIHTRGYLRELEAQESLWNGFLEMPHPKTPLDPVEFPSIYKNTSNTDVMAHAGRLLTLWEGDLPYEVNPHTLETVGMHDFKGTWSSPVIAHPKRDAHTQEVVFSSTQFNKVPAFQYGVIGPNGEIVHSAEVEIDIPCMTHDIGMTENYSILLHLPYTFDLHRFVEGGMSFGWEPDRKARFGIIPRLGTEVQWFEGPPCYIFHILNAYEEGDEIIMHAPRLAQTRIMDRTAGWFGEEDPLTELEGGDWAGRMHEWRFNLKTGELKERELDSTFVDFPQVPSALVGRPYRYGYSVRLADQLGREPAMFDGIVKHDFQTETHEFVPFDAECYGHECAVVTKPNATKEDDVWLITFLYDEFHRQSQLVIYEGDQLAQGPIAKVMIPQRMPYGFHIKWLDAQFLWG